MEKLRREHDNLKAELAMEFRHFKKPPDSASSERVAQLQEQAERFVQATNSEKRNIDAIAKQTALMKHKILNQRKIMGGVNAAKENDFMVQKQVRILENRLDKALTKFNEVLARNKILRQEIDDLRRERVLFEGIYKKVGKELSDRKKMMADVIELSNINYEQRDNFQLEVTAVEQANRREHDDFQHQMLDFGRQMEMELPSGALGASAPTSSGSAPGLMGAYGSNEVTSKAILTTRSASGSRDDDSAKVARLNLRPGMLTDSEESRVKARGGKVKADKTDAQASLERIQNFEEAFNRIRSATGIEDIEQLVRTFVKNEDQNFSLFNYVNEQQNEVEKLEEQLQQLEEEKKRFAQESGSDVHQHKQVLKDLEEKLAHTETASEKYELRCSEASQTLEALKDRVHNLFGSMHSSETLPETAGGGRATDSNIMMLLGMIEEKTNSLLQEFACAKEREKAGPQAATASIAGAGERGAGEDYSLAGRALVAAAGNASGSGAALATVLGRGPQTPMRQELIHVNPPKLEDFSSSDQSGSDDDCARPLTRDELKGRTLNKIQRKNAREGGARSKGRGGRAK